ncbi:HD domain-containing protein [Candidatus Micrarchaeota archaeon]|nr:HD domain-containing protein [Candidatus Micrarchaeota archaeon]
MAFHHFIGNGLNRSEKIQLWVVNTLLNSGIPNEKRESSIQWELKHTSGVIQLARLLAQKRNVNEELAIIAAALHDAHLITNGNYAEHAKKSAIIARNLLESSQNFSKDEIDEICEAITKHSEKHIYSSNKLVELIKDADCLDCFLYTGNGYDEKPKDVLRHYYKRIIQIRRELGLPEEKCFIKRLTELGE